MRRFIFLIILIFVAFIKPCSAADVAINDLTADASPTADDLVETEDSPGGTPGSRKVTLGNLPKAMTSTNLIDTANIGYLNQNEAIGASITWTVNGALDINGTIDMTDGAFTGLVFVDANIPDSITVNPINSTTEGAIESTIELQELQGAVVDSQVPNNITVDLATVATTANNLAADGVDALTEISQGIKSAANDTSVLVVGTPGSTDECAKWDANGNLVTAGAACGSGGSGGSGAPTNATYLTLTSNGTLTAEVAVGVVDDSTIVGNGTTMQAKVITDCDGNGSAMNYDTTTNAFSCKTIADADVPNTITIDLSTSSSGLACTNCVDGTEIALGSDAAGDIMYYNGTDYVRLAKGTAGQVLEMNAGATAPEWDTDDSGGAGTPGGSDTQVQYNDGGALGGDAGMVFDKTTNAFTVDGTGTFDAIVTNGSGDSILTSSGSMDIGGTTHEKIHLDFTTSNTVIATSTTGVTAFNFSSIALQESGVGVLNADEIDASSELLAIMDDESGSGLLAFATNPLFTGARFGNGATTGGFLDIVEDSDNGTNRIRFTAPSAITSDVECILENDGNPIPDSCVGDGTDGGGGSGAFSDASDPVVLNTTTKDVAVGAALINAAKLSVDGDADQVQFAIQAHSTQNQNVIEVENSGGTIQFSLNNFGVFPIWHGGFLSDSDAIAFDGVNVFGSGSDLTVDGTLIPTAFDMPSGAAPTTNATGEIALDTTITDHQPFLQYFDGGENMTVIAIDTAELPASDNEIIKYDAATDKFVLEADAGGGGSSTQSIVINPASMSLTGTIALTGDATVGATIDASNGGVLLFSSTDGNTDSGAGWRGKLPSNWSAHGTIKINYSMTTGTANEVEWEAAIMCTSPGDSARDDADSFAAFATASDTVPGTVRFPDTVSITPTDDSCAAGDDIMINISTDADDATLDDATGTRRLIGLIYEYTAS